MVNIVPFLGRGKDPSNPQQNNTKSSSKPKTVSFPQDSISNTSKPRDQQPTCDKPSKTKPTKSFNLSNYQIKPQSPPRSSQKSNFEIANEILAEEKATQEAEKDFWRKRNEEARQRYYGVKGGRPRYGWESPNAKTPKSAKDSSQSKISSSRSKPPSQPKTTSTQSTASSKLEVPSNPARLKLGDLRLEKSHSERVGVKSPTPSTREVWNTLYAKNQEIHSLRLSHQEMLEELHAHQIGLRYHKRALDEARWESEECYQTLSLLNRLAGEGKRFDEKVWLERIQLRNRLRQLEEETKELKVKGEQCRQMLESVDAIWFKEWEEKEILIQELKGAKAENKRLSVELRDVYKRAGRDRLDTRLERRDSSRDGEFYDAPERAGQCGGGSGKCSPPGRVEAEGPRVPPRISSLHWQNLARSASARREQFEKEERSKSKTMPKPNKSLEIPQVQFEEERLSLQPGQDWWSQLYGWPCSTRVLTV